MLEDYSGKSGYLEIYLSSYGKSGYLDYDLSWNDNEFDIF